MYELRLVNSGRLLGVCDIDVRLRSARRDDLVLGVHA